MYHLSEIIRRNREAVEQGVKVAGVTPVGTKTAVDEPNIHPYRVVAGLREPATIGEMFACNGAPSQLITTWAIALPDGQVLKRWDGLPINPNGCEQAHQEAAVMAEEFRAKCEQDVRQ